MLKGAVLCGKYPNGCRTSNDIDLLLLPEHITELGDVLEAAGFRQGELKSGAFVPATRREIIASRMMRGETVPYILELRLPMMQYLEVDLNFSLTTKTAAPTRSKKCFRKPSGFLSEIRPCRRSAKRTSSFTSAGICIRRPRRFPEFR